MADTTTATSLPASTSRFTRAATLRMRSRSATEVPPNFITMRAIRAVTWWEGAMRAEVVLCGGAAHILVAARGGQAGDLAQQGGLMMQQAGVSAAEVARFDALADRWWDPRWADAAAAPDEPAARRLDRRAHSCPVRAAQRAAAGRRLRRRARRRGAGAARPRRAGHRRGRGGDRGGARAMPRPGPAARLPRRRWPRTCWRKASASRRSPRWR